MKIKIKSKKEITVTTDTLPFELPIIFSNESFYKFIVENEINCNDKNIEWKTGTEIINKTVGLLFGIKKEVISSNGKSFFSNFKKSDMLSIPYGYNISHKESSFRELTICHPKNQLKIIDFYNQYKDLIIYYSNISPFSIRKPVGVAKFLVHNDKSFKESLADDIGEIEESGKEYAHIHSFFVYKNYSNIYKFYESDTYHECEKKYNKLLKIDISNCFDSIYTHSIAWAIYGKDSVKSVIASGGGGTLESTFPGSFDRLMRELNYNETNGIVIGPEFSRIFAELILQSVDQDTFTTLKESHKILREIDYEIFRYVDDYFIFYNDDNHQKTIHEVIQISLKKFNLYLNSSKEKIYEKPLITEVTIAKSNLSKLLQDKIKYLIDDIPNDPKLKNTECKPIKTGAINVNPRSLIIDFKIIIKNSNVDYKDIMNYSLFIIEKKCRGLISDFLIIEKYKNTENDFVEAVTVVLEFLFFIYSVSPRVNTTIKLCRVINIFIVFFKTESISHDCRHIIFKYINDNICFLLNKNRSTENVQVETLYLLITLQQLGREYWLDVSALRTYFNISKENVITHDLNYFSITVLFFYMKDKVRYNDIRSALETHIIETFNSRKNTIHLDAELSMLLMDTLSCPYITRGTKYSLLALHEISNREIQDSIIDLHPTWFTKWVGFDLEKELDSKRMLDVY